jgi:hypothetical protein
VAATAAEVEKVLRKDLREMEKLSSGLESRIAEGNSYIGLAVAQEEGGKNSKIQPSKIQLLSRSIGPKRGLQKEGGRRWNSQPRENSKIQTSKFSSSFASA